MNWLTWLLFAACCGVCFAIGWSLSGLVAEREEETGG